MSKEEEFNGAGEIYSPVGWEPITAGSILVHARVLTLPQRDYVRLLVRVLQFVGLSAIAYSLVVDE